MSTRHFSFCSSPYLVYFSFISVPPIFTIIASTKCLSTIQNGSLSLGIFLWGWGYLVYFSLISVPPIFTSVACSECWSTIQNVSLSLGIFLWGWGYLVYFSFISVPPIFTSVACSRNWSTIQNVSQSLGIFLWGWEGGRLLGGGWTGLLLGTYTGCLSTWGPVTVSCSGALGYPFLWGLGWGDLVGDWSG